MHFNNHVLAVDDDPTNLSILEELLDSDYTVRCARSGEEALQIAAEFDPDLLLVDVMMPGIDGLETCRRLRAHPRLRSSHVVMVSARGEVPDRLAAYSVGAVDYVVKPFDHDEIAAKVRTWMQMVQREKADAVWCEAETARQVVGTSMQDLASFRDTETGDHIARVRWYSRALAEVLAVAGPYCLQVDEEFRANLDRASPLHDVGKVAIPDSILRKPGPLTENEFEIMKTHAVIGYDLIRTAARKLPAAPYLSMAADIARHHHERFDGRGYPDRLEGTRIPLAARIVCVADVFDALTSKRVYKDAIPVADALQTIADGAVYQFDPAIVLALQARARDFERVHEDLANAASSALSWRGRSSGGSAGAIDLQRLNALERFRNA